MKKVFWSFIIGLIVASIVFTSIYFSYLKRPANTETITVVDTLIVTHTKSYPVYIKEIVPEIIYISPDSLRYIATSDTTIVLDKLTAELKTIYKHPEKIFQFEYDFHVKVDSVYITNNTTEYKYINNIKTFSPTIGVGLIKSHAEDTLLLSLDTGIIYKNRFGLQLLAMSDLSLGLRLQALF